MSARRAASHCGGARSAASGAVGSDNFDFWVLLGDNFYDADGSISAEFFAEVSLSAKAKPLFTVPGNHDFWIVGDPRHAHPDDQFGNGFMQFYGQDTVAANGTAPFSFDRNADELELAGAENFIFRSQIGDVDLFGYSGAHSWIETEPHAQAFCEHVGTTPSVHVAVLLGHWNAPFMGCLPGMEVPHVYRLMRALPGCSDKPFLHFQGHQHCNMVIDAATGPADAVGFMLGAVGMGGTMCAYNSVTAMQVAAGYAGAFDTGCAQFGFAVLETVPDAPGGPDARVDYFGVTDMTSFGTTPTNPGDRFLALMECLQQQEYSTCRDKFSVSFRNTQGTSGEQPPYVNLPELDIMQIAARCRRAGQYDILALICFTGVLVVLIGLSVKICCSLGHYKESGQKESEECDSNDPQE